MKPRARAESAEPRPEPYGGPWQHLSEELRRLDLLIRSRLNGLSGGTLEGPLAQLKGLVLTEQEITTILEAGTEPAGGAGQVEEAARLDAAARDLGRRIEARQAASVEAGVRLPLVRLSGLFQLSRLEERSLLVCLAPEIDRRYEKLYAYLQDDITRKRPSLDLIAALEGLGPIERLRLRESFSAEAPLVRYRLVHLTTTGPDGRMPLLTRPMKLDDRIVDLLLGSDGMDGRLLPAARLQPPGEGQACDLPAALANRMRTFVRSFWPSRDRSPGSVIFHLSGPYGGGKRALAELAARELGLPLLLADAGRIKALDLPPAEALWLLAREACLQPAVLCVQECDPLLSGDGDQAPLGHVLLEATRLCSQLTFLLGGRPWQPKDRLPDTTFIGLQLARPESQDRARIWQEQLEKLGIEGRVSAEVLGGAFRFTPGQIRDAVGAGRGLAAWRSPADGGVHAEDLAAACRAQANPELARLARKIEPRYGWKDIVLPADPLCQLAEICDQSRFRHLVLGDWGFGRKLSLGKGLAALFSGPPGTGKTMAAEVIASELQLDLYKIDLSQVVSKYIGETEKNLDRIFKAAAEGNVILFFDEADALFGKRSEVRDSHDRYANVEISYLLQKMEEHEGISILATNLRQHIDSAFLRRLQSVVEFPFPDTAARERIWRVTLPREAPVGEDVDFALLARDLRLAGGNIKNIGLNAAYSAAGDGGMIRLVHLLHAARREHQKLGRTWREPSWAPAEAVPA